MLVVRGCIRPPQGSLGRQNCPSVSSFERTLGGLAQISCLLKHLQTSHRMIPMTPGLGLLPYGLWKIKRHPSASFLQEAKPGPGPVRVPEWRHDSKTISVEEIGGCPGFPRGIPAALCKPARAPQATPVAGI